MSDEPNFMYIGPTIISIGLKRNTIYRGVDAMPVQLKNLVATTPMLSSLYVPTGRLAEARKNLTKVGAIERIAFNELVKMTKAVGVKGTTITNHRR